MDPTLIACWICMAAIGPLAAASSFVLKRWWQVAACLMALSLVGWALLLFAYSIEQAAYVAACEAIKTPSIEDLERCSSDGAAGSVAFLLGLPIFALYSLICIGLSQAVRAIVRRVIHA